MDSKQYKRELEIEKLEFEIKELSRPLYKRPSILATFATIAVALCTLVAAQLPGWLDEQKQQLKKEKADLLAENERLRLDGSTLQGQLDVRNQEFERLANFQEVSDELTKRAREATTATHTAQLEVHIIDVGQGDAIFIRCPDGEHELLIDSGDNRYRNSGSNFRSYMLTHQADDNAIEVVIATHPHADHIGNLAWLLDTFTVDLYVDNGNEYNSRTYERLEESINNNSVPYYSVQYEIVPAIDFCSRDDVSATILRPTGFGNSSDPNDNSVIVRIDYGDDSFLFVGDCEAEEESLLLADGVIRAQLDCDFLKVSHHGSYSSSSHAFLEAVSPDLAAVSCGAVGVSTNARYKHPRVSTITRLLDFVLPRTGPSPLLDAFDSNTRQWRQVPLTGSVYVTAIDGDIVFESNGEGIRKR